MLSTDEIDVEDLIYRSGKQIRRYAVKPPKKRSLKVFSQSGYKFQPTPCIRMHGRWLEAFGFGIGCKVEVSCEEGKLIISKKLQ